MKNIIPRKYYRNPDVVFLARDLIGKVLCSTIAGNYCSGMIMETEAYEGVTDRASHAYGSRRTKRNEVMYGEAGFAYIYLCYGIHSLFNIVTHSPGVPHAILIRGIAPLEGLDTMSARCHKPISRDTVLDGPGKLSLAMEFHTRFNATDITQQAARDAIWLENRQIQVNSSQIQVSKRIGVDYAGEHAKLPYRFILTQNG